MQKRRITVQKTHEADPAATAKLVQAANDFDSKIYLEFGENCLNAKSIMGMMNLNITTGDQISIFADGTDEADALDRLETFFVH